MILDEPEGYELITVGSDYRTLDNVIWRKYRTVTIGVLERTLDDNPHLAKLHKHSPFLPVGTQIRIPIYPSILAGSPQPETLIRWWEPIGNRIKTVAQRVIARTGSSLPTPQQEDDLG